MALYELGLSVSVVGMYTVSVVCSPARPMHIFYSYNLQECQTDAESFDVISAANCCHNSVRGHAGRLESFGCLVCSEVFSLCQPGLQMLFFKHSLAS